MVQCFAERPGERAPRLFDARSWSLPMAGFQLSRMMSLQASRCQKGVRPARKCDAAPTQLPRYGARGQTAELPKGDARSARRQRSIPDEGTTLVLMAQRQTSEER